MFEVILHGCHPVDECEYYFIKWIQYSFWNENDHNLLVPSIYPTNMALVLKRMPVYKGKNSSCEGSFPCSLLVLKFCWACYENVIRSILISKLSLYINVYVHTFFQIRQSLIGQVAASAWTILLKQNAAQLLLGISWRWSPVNYFGGLPVICRLILLVKGRAFCQCWLQTFLTTKAK
jgi:hypothetical protein